MSWKPFGRGAPSNSEQNNNYNKPRNNQNQQNQGWNQNAPNNQGGGRGRGQNRGRGRGQKFTNFPDRFGNSPNNQMMDDDTGSNTPVFGSFGSSNAGSFGAGSTFTGFGGASSTFGQPSSNTGSFGSTSASFGSEGSVFGGGSFETFPKPNRNQWQSGNDSEMMADANEGFSGRGRGRGRGRGQNNQDDSWRANPGRGRGRYQSDDTMNDSDSFVPNAGRGRGRRFGQQEQDMDMMDNADQGDNGGQFFSEGGRGRGRGRGRNYDQTEVEMTDYETSQGRGRGRGRGRADQVDDWRVKPGRGQSDQEDTWRANPGRGRGRGGYQATMEQDEEVPFRPAGRGRGRGGFGQQEQDLEMNEEPQEKPWGRGRGRGRADQEESWRVKPARAQADQEDWRVKMSDPADQQGTWRVKPGRGRGRGDTEPTEGLFQKPFKRQQSFGEEQTTARPAFAQDAEEDGDHDNHTLFFKGIPPIGLQEAHVRRITSGYGPVKKLVVNPGKRFAIVEYASKQAAINAKAKLKAFPLPDGGMARVKVFWSTKSVDEASAQRTEEAPERPAPRSPEFDMPVARPKKPIEANPKQGRQGSFLGRDTQPLQEDDTPGRSVFDDEDLMRKTQRGQRFSPVAQPKFSAASPKAPSMTFSVQRSTDEEDTQEDDGAEERLLIHASSAGSGGGPKFNITFGDTPSKPADKPKPAQSRLLSASLRATAGKDTEEEKPQPVPAQPAEQPRKPVMFVVPERKPKPVEPEPEEDEGEDYDEEEGEGDYDEEEGEDYDEEEGEEGYDEEGEDYDEEEGDEEAEGEGTEADYDADHGGDEEAEEGDEDQGDDEEEEPVKPPSFVRRSPVAIKPPEVAQRGVSRPPTQILPPRGASKELRQRIDEFYRQVKSRPKPKSRVIIPEGKLVGYCQEKCPEPERYDRERTKDLSLFEMVPGTERTSLPSVKHEWAVKKYKRPSGKLDQQPEYLPEEVRPGPVLLMTTDYLIENILDRTDRPFLEVHNFVRDRARSVRQDFTIQGLFNEETLAIYERMARFHIFSDQLLCEEDASNFDPGQNTEQLDKVLISCREMYDNFRALGIECVNEPEFRAYLLFIVEEEGEFFNLLKSVPEAIFASPEVQFAVKARLALQDNNYVLYFKMTKQADYLMACLMHKYFTNVRKKALKTMTRAYRDLIPFSMLTRVMMFENEEDAVNFCTYHGLSKTDEGIPKGSSFIEPKMAIGRVKSSYIESKRGPFKLSDIVNLTPSQRAEFLKTEVEEEPVNIQVNVAVPRAEPKVSLRQSGKAQPAAVKEPAPVAVAPPALRVSRKVKPTEVTPPKAVEAPKITLTPAVPTPGQRPPSPAVKAPSFTFPTLTQPTPIPATPKFDFNSLPNLDDAFMTTPIVFAPQPAAPKVAPPTNNWLQPLPVPQVPVPSAPSPLRKSMERPQMRPTTPVQSVLNMLEPDEALSVSSEESKHAEPAWEPSVQDLPFVDEPQGPSLEERLEEYLAAKRHDLASRAFSAWRYWAAGRANERKAVEKAAKRAMRTRPMRLMSPKPAAKEGSPIDYDYYVNTQQRQEAFQNILASLRQRADVRRKEYWSAIDLPKIIFPSLRKKNSKQHSLFWKLVVVADGAQPVSSQLDAESLDDPNISDWLVAKFSRGGVDLPDTVDQLPILSLYKSEWNDLNLDDNFDEDRPQENTSLRVCVKLVNDIEHNNKNALQHELQGTHCLLYYFPPADRIDNAYWKKHLAHLEKLINSLHPHSQAPLLLVFPTSGDDTEINQTINQVKALFAEKLPREVISQFCFMFVPKNNEAKALSKRNKKLAKGVKWLAEHTPKQPKLASYFLKDVLENKVELLLANMSQRQKQTEFIKYVKPTEAEAIQPEIYVSEFNTQISRVIDDLNDHSNRDVAFWPVPEFTVRLNDEDTDLSEQLPPADWNTDSYFNAVQSAVDSIILPEFTYTDDVTDEQGLISCCLNYLKKLDFGAANWSANILPLANHIHYLLVKRRQKESETKRRAPFPWLQIFEAIFYFRLAQNEKKYQHQRVAFVRSSKFKDYRKQLQDAYIESLVAPSAARLAGLLSMAPQSASVDRPIVLLDDMLTPVNKKEESDQVQEKKRTKIDEIIARQKQARNELENLLHEIEQEKLKSRLIQLEVDQKIKNLMPSSASLALISSSPVTPKTPRKVSITIPAPSATSVLEDISMGEENVQEETDIVQAVIKRQERKRKLYENLFSQIEEEKRKYRRLEHMTDKYE